MTKVNKNTDSTNIVNGYLKLHSELMELFGRYHNDHVRFIDNPTYFASQHIGTHIIDIGQLAAVMKRYNIKMRRELKIIKAELFKVQAAEKKKAALIKAAKKQK